MRSQAWIFLISCKNDVSKWPSGKKDGVLKRFIFYSFLRRQKGFKLIVLARKGTRLILFFVWSQSIIYIIHSLNYPVVTLRPIYFNQRLLFSEPISIVYLNQVRHRWTPKSSICLHQNYYFGPSSRWKCNESWSNNHGLSFCQ